jgi:adhesin transport system outer membrane protein
MQSAAKRTKRLTSKRLRLRPAPWTQAASFLALAAFLGVAQPAAATSLEKELANLLLDHPQIQAAAKNVEASHYNLAKSRAGFFPKVSTTGSVGPSIIDSPSTRQVGDGGDFTRTEIIGGVTVTQNLFNGFLTTSQVRAAAINRAIAQITLRTATQTAMFEAIQAYIDVLRQKRLLELARENEATIQRQLNLEDERVQRGSGVAVDVLQAKSRLQIAKERRVSIEGALQDAISRYAQVYNRAPKVDEMTDPVPPVELVPSELERAIEIALAENPSIANTGATVEANRERRNIVRAELFPSFDLVGKTNYEHNRNAEIGTRRDYSLVLQATWDLFTGFSTRAGQAQAAFEYAASKDNHRQAARKVTEQVRIAWQALLTARERLELLENAVNIASEVFDSRRKLREAGKETVINVLDAENEVNNAQINFTGAAYEERTSVYQLLLAMGRLNAASLNIVVE